MMRSVMPVRLLGTVLAAALAAVCAVAPAAQERAAADVLQSVVKVEVTVPGEARTANTLGRQREGSGVVIDGEGLVLTIGYVILEADSIEIEQHDGKRLPASLVAYDHDTGFGLVRTAVPAGVRPMELGSSEALAQRQPVLVAGHGGASQAMGAFVVDRRDFAGYWEYLLEKAIFTAPPYPNFGGAALIEAGGKLVGIGSLIVPNAIEAEDRMLPGNMFIPIDALKPILAELIDKGRASGPGRPWLGIYTQEIQDRLLIGRVPQSGPAWTAGVRPGDVVLAVDGAPVDGLADFYRKIWALGGPGVAVPLLVLRDNRPAEITVRSIDRYKWLRLRPTY